MTNFCDHGFSMPETCKDCLKAAINTAIKGLDDLASNTNDPDLYSDLRLIIMKLQTAISAVSEKK